MRRLVTSPRSPLHRRARGEGVRLTVAAKQQCPVDTNRLRSGIGYRLVPNYPRLVVRVQTSTVGGSLGYARSVHNGTRPHWPPPGALDDWARRHGIPNGYLVARVIAARGTFAKPFLTNPLIAGFPNARIYAQLRR